MVISHQSPLPSVVPPPIPLPPDSFRLQTARLHGFQFRGHEKSLYQMTLGDELALIAEPANPHDKYAVRVHWQDKRIGYLPRKSNHVVSRLLRQGAPVTAVIAWLDIAAEFSVPLTLHILLSKKAESKPKKK